MRREDDVGGHHDYSKKRCQLLSNFLSEYALGPKTVC